MESRLCFLAAVLLTSCVSDVTMVDSQGVDSTKVPDTSGTDVVLTVTNLIQASCILTSDRQFLRRLAYVETRDGTLPDTYQTGYDGGIWKVDRNMFDATKSCPSDIRSTCDQIQQQFHIDWTHVQWSDLRKPLYSGLAATLYILLQTGGNQSAIPAALDEQAMFWTRYYHREGNRANFSLLADETTHFECNKPLDIAFILDSSGSIADQDFQLSLNFVADVVAAMKVPEYARIAALIFEDVATVEFNFNTYHSEQQIINAIKGIQRSSGGTATSVALNTARSTLFSTSNGARAGVTRVAVLLTDGQSNDQTQTSIAARSLREAGVTVYAIGIGGYNLQELMDVASEPKCSHVYTLSDFSQINSILYEIQERTCKANTAVTDGNSAECRVDERCSVSVDSLNPTEVIANCSIAEIYTSYTNPNPGPAFYSQKFTATDGHPAYISTTGSHDGQPLYMTVVGRNLPEDLAKLRNCEGMPGNVQIGVVEHADVRCCHGGECHVCSNDELRRYPNIRQIICSNYYEEFANPCTPEAMSGGHVIFPYPYDQNRFIRCDYHGNPYVTLCPNRQTFNRATLTCGYTSSGSVTRIPLPTSYPNPCTREHIQAQYLYFAYPPDHQRFIHCDLWGDAWLETCPALQVWSQDDLVCVSDRPAGVQATTSSPGTLVNPCTPEAEAAGKQFFPYPCDHTRFIHCGVGGAYWVQFCPGGMYFDPATYICVVGDPQLHQGGCGE